MGDIRAGWLDAVAALDPCGYVVRLAVVDRAVLGSASFGRAVYVERGLCLE